MDIPRITAGDLRQRLESGEALTVVDVRSAGDFEIEHLSGARSLSVKELPQRYPELPTDHTIVCY